MNKSNGIQVLLQTLRNSTPIYFMATCIYSNVSVTFIKCNGVKTLIIVVVFTAKLGNVMYMEMQV